MITYILMSMYAQVSLAKTSSFLDKLYTYYIPETLADKVQVGSQVLVPFGKRQEKGYVIEINDKAEVAEVKAILEVVGEKPVFSETTAKLAKWLAAHYFSFFLRALDLFLPPKGKTTNPKPQITNNTKAPISKLQINLTEEQAVACKEIKRSIKTEQAEVFLLYGITGSGKTEVYIRAVEAVLSLGKGTIVLVPEIGLTSQLISRFRERFQDDIAILHSGLTDKRRREEWLKVEAGEAKIVLGTRLALFAPVKNLGLIVIDEEYENTYKSDMSPRYHAREVALELAKLNKATLVLGSATPSMETFYKAEIGEYKKLVLTKRIDDKPLPPVTLIDMRQELKAGNYSVLSRKLQKGLTEVLDKGEQAILFINRSGYYTFVMCRECGLTIECPNCTTSLIYDSHGRELRCGQCGYSTKNPAICPRCQSTAIKYFGAGTQRIADEMAKLFPKIRILRIDRDAVTKKGSHEEIFEAFSQGKADVLIGTQMVTKGLDLASVTLVGVVAADTALNLPDFRAAEHTFQMLTQVAGRAGRHHLPGRVIIQTYNPDHYAIQAAAKHDYEGFYRQEIQYRQELFYPPFSSLIRLLVSGAAEKAVTKAAEELAEKLKNKDKDMVLGPIPAAIAKKQGLWRYQIVIKGKEMAETQKALRATLEQIKIPKNIKYSIDVDPINF